jgi:hypothetical protein
MSWHDLTGKRLRVGDEVGEVVHVDAFRVVLLTEGDDGEPHRVILSPDEPFDVDAAADGGAS